MIQLHYVRCRLALLFAFYPMTTHRGGSDEGALAIKPRRLQKIIGFKNERVNEGRAQQEKAHRTRDSQLEPRTDPERHRDAANEAHG